MHKSLIRGILSNEQLQYTDVLGVNIFFILFFYHNTIKYMLHVINIGSAA